MSQLESRCVDCGRPVLGRVLCPACEQDRMMQQSELASAASSGKGLRCND